MINHNFKFIFIHIPRTGGTSLEEQFNFNEKVENNKHWSLEDWKQSLDQTTFNTYLKFTFIRNPWDIIISKYLSSWYNHNRRGGNIGFHSGKTLEYFLEHYKPAPWEHGDSLLDYFNVDEIDFIGRDENRENDLNYISEKIKHPIAFNVWVRSNNKTKHYTEYYNNRTQEIVANRYIKDIECFKYKFGE